MYQDRDHAPAIDSTDYYGIVFIVYISWCAIVGGAGLFTNEKKNCIIERLQVSNLSILQVYLARLIPASILSLFSKMDESIPSKTVKTISKKDSVDLTHEQEDQIVIFCTISLMIGILLGNAMSANIAAFTLWSMSSR